MQLRLRVSGPNNLRANYIIQQGATVIGRKRMPAEPADVPHPEAVLGIDPSRVVRIELDIDTPRVARSHLMLQCTEDECWLTDLGSEFGVRLNDRRIEPFSRTQLRTSDRLVIGLDYELRFEDVAPAHKPVTPEDDEPLPNGYVPQPPAPRVVYYDGEVPPGLLDRSVRLQQYLPEAYQPSVNGHILKFDLSGAEQSHGFLGRFLALFESILLPVEWTLDNFDLLLSPATAPKDFLSWFEQWFLILSDSTWTDEQRRMLASEADELFAWRGTRRAMSRILEIYTGAKPDIDDEDPDLPQNTFRVKVNQATPDRGGIDEKVVASIVEAFKPAHTTWIT